HQKALIGIGINITTDLSCAPAQVQQRAVSLEESAKRSYQKGALAPRRTDLFVSLYHALVQALDDPNWLSAFHQCDALRDKNITVDTGEEIISCRCQGIDKPGSWLVDDHRRRCALLSGKIICWYSSRMSV